MRYESINTISIDIYREQREQKEDLLKKLKADIGAAVIDHLADANSIRRVFVREIEDYHPSTDFVKIGYVAFVSDNPEVYNVPVINAREAG